MKDEETEESAWGKNRNYIIKRDTYIERHHQESQRLNENAKKTQDKKNQKKKIRGKKKKRHRQEDLHSDSVRLYQPIN